MKAMRNGWILALCLFSLVEAAHAQQMGYFRTRQSGGWNDNIWEQFSGTVWSPSTAPTAANSNGILIVAGHEVTTNFSNLTVDQLRIEGTLNVSAGRTLTVVNGPDIDLVVDHPNALLRILGTLVNNGQISIEQGGFQIGNVQNNGSIALSTTLTFSLGTFTGNDLMYGPAGSLAINATSGYAINQNSQIWPAANGPNAVTVHTSATLVGNRTVSGTLDVIGTLHVLGSLTNAGTVHVPGKLEVTGAYHNNSTTEIPGRFKINPAGAVTGNGFVYTGCCNVLEFGGTSFTYDIDAGNAFWPGTNHPHRVIIPNNLQVNVNATRAAGRIDLNYYATLQAAGVLATNDSSAIVGTFLVPGMYVNNGTVEVRLCEVSGSFVNNGTAQFLSTISTCRVSGTVVNNGAMLFNGTFQIDEGATISGQDFSYGQNGKLVFNNSSGAYPVGSESPFWPDEDLPAIIQVNGPGGIVLNEPKNMPAILQVAAGVHNSGNLLVSGTVWINPGGYFDASPVYSGNARLIYSTGGLYHAGPEWAGGTSVGTGVPMHVEVINSSTVVLPDSPRRCPGNLYIEGTELILGNAPGADLYIGGNWRNNGLLTPNFRRVVFDGTAEQLLMGATGFDFLTIDNPAGVRFWAEYYWECPFVTVHEALTLIAGNIALGGEDYVCTLVLEGLVEGVSAGRHVVTFENGYVVRTISQGESFLFPVGPTATSYNPMTVALPAQATGGIFRVRVDSTIVLPEVDAAYSVNRTWHLMNEIYCEAPNGPHDEGDSVFIRLTFQWDGADEGVLFTRETSAAYEGETEYANDPASGTDPYAAITSDPLLYRPLGQTFIISNAGDLTDTEELSADGQPSFHLSQNVPNPAGGSTLIRYRIPEAGYVQLSVFDALGREVEQLVQGMQPGGAHEVVWNPAGLPNGVYFYRLQAGAFVGLRKVMVLR